MANVNGGTLSVNGTFGDTAANAARINVNNGGTLHGSGTIDGSVVVNSGGTVSAGNSPGTLTVAGSYTLNAGSTSLFELGTAGVPGGATNDYVIVGGNLTLGGTLRLVNSADATMNPAAGNYFLYTYGSTLAGQFATITSPANTSTFTVTTNVPGQVNLTVAGAGQSVQYFDGADTTGATPGVQGGSGVWNNATTNWTNQAGTANSVWGSGVGIFTTTGGAVTVTGAQAVQGLQFSATGYNLGGTGSLTLTGDPYTTANQSFVTVDAGVAATIAMPLTGPGIGLIKYGTGTLILSGANSYTGVTTVSAGVLQGTTTSIVGSNIVDNATLVYNQAAAGTSARAISGSGVVQVNGGGNVSLTGAITVTGGVQVGAGTTATLSNVSNANTAANSNAVTFTGAGATLNVAQGGSVTAATGNAVYSNQANNIVNNAGLLAGNATYTGVYLQSAAAGTNMIANAATGTIRGYDGVYSRADLGLTNAGTITALTNNGITALGVSTITNQVGGVINATATGGFGIDGEGTTLTAVNAGTINADYGVVKVRSTGTLNNTGAINGATVGVSTLVGGTLTVTNSGTIAASAGEGVNFVAGGSVTNSGAISGTTVGVLSTGGALTLTSTGTIRTTGGTYAIQSTGAFADAVTLGSGSTTTGTVALGDGADTLTLVTGASAPGTLDGGAGTDTLVLDGTGTGTLGSAQVVNFENGVKQGSGNWTLTGTVAASPTSFAINAGTLNVAGGNALADTATVTVAAGGTLGLLANETIGGLSGAGAVTLGANMLTLGGGNVIASFAGVASGTGGLTKVGTGTETLSGANSYTGATTVNAGTLALGANNAIGAGSALSVAQGATFDLAGYNETIGQLTGAGAVTLGAGTLTTGGNNTDSTFAGTLSGTGNLTKVGNATLTLTGANTLTGALNVQAGTLLLLGSVAGAARVAGGTLAGTGQVAGNLAVSSGTLSVGTPTAAIGTLSAGSLAVTGGTSVFDFAGSTGGFTADRLNIAGAVTLSGGLVSARATEASANYRVMQTYTLIQGGSVAGTFANGGTFTQALGASDLFYRLRYDLAPNAVVLEVRKQIDFTAGLAGAGASGNQLAVATALNGSALTASDAYAGFLNAYQGLGTGDRLATLNSISGEGIADISTSVGLMNRRFTELLRRRLATGGGSGGNAGLLAAVADGSRGLANARAVGALDGSSQSFADGTGDASARGGAWVQSFGGYGLLRGQAGSANLYDQSYGVAAGIDGRLGPVMVGVAGSGAGVDTRVTARVTRGNGTIYQAAGYAAYDDGRLFANLIGTYFSGDVTSKRSVFVGTTLFGQASGTSRAHGYGGSASAGYRFDLGNGWRYTPQVSVEATHVRRDAFTETGAGVLNLAVATQRRTLYQADAEGRLSHLFALGGNGGTVEPYVGGGFNANWGNRAALNTMTITGAPAGTGLFAIDGANLARYTGVITGGIDGHPSDRVTLGVGLQTHRSPRQKDGAVQVHARIAF